jgi:hypothetical protein
MSLNFFTALQIISLFFLQENDLRKALIPFIGVRTYLNPLKKQKVEPLAELLKLTILSFRPSEEIFSSTNKISTMKDSSLRSE